MASNIVSKIVIEGKEYTGNNLYNWAVMPAKRGDIASIELGKKKYEVGFWIDKNKTAHSTIGSKMGFLHPVVYSSKNGSNVISIREVGHVNWDYFLYWRE